MAWSAPAVFVSGNVLTAAQMNVLAGDLLVTIPGIASQGLVVDPPYIGGTTYAPGVYAASAVNAVQEMRPGQQTVYTFETTTSSAFADLATVGPQVEVTCHNFAIVFANLLIQADTANTAASGWGVTGLTTIAPTNNGPSINNSPGNQWTSATMRSTSALNAGLNTFTLQYVVTAGTIGTFGRRHMTVWPF